MELTRQNYTYSLNRHIMPAFAEFRMVDILPAVREWVAKLQVQRRQRRLTPGKAG